MTNEEINALRKLTQQVVSEISARGLFQITRAMGHPLKSLDTFEKFISGRNVRYNADDLAALDAFYHRTKPGRGLVRMAALSLPVVRDIVDAATSEATRLFARRLEGTYLAYHGSHLVEGHFVVRAVEIKLTDRGIVQIEDRLRDEKSFGGVKHHHAFGVLAIFEDRPHILFFRHDNTRGFNLLIVDRFDPDKDRHQITNISASMIGMTKERQHFYRSLSLYRERDSISTLERRTGIKPFKRWSSHNQQRLMTLRRDLPSQPFADPILSLTPSDDP